MQEGSLRCLCGRPFLPDFLPTKFHAQRDILEKLDRESGRWGWNKDGNDEDQMECDDNDKGGDVAKTPAEIDDLKNQLAKEEALAKQLVDEYGTSIPEKMAAKIKSLKDQIDASAVVPEELAKSDYAKQTAVLNKEVRKSQGTLSAKTKALQKKFDEQKSLEEKIRDNVAFIVALKSEVAEAESAVAEATRRLADHSSTVSGADAEADAEETADEECVYEAQARANKEYQATVDAKAEDRIAQYIQQYTAHMQAAASATSSTPTAFSFHHQVPVELQQRIETAKQALETATLAAKDKSKTKKTLKSSSLTKASAELKAAQEAAAAIAKNAAGK